MKFVQIKNPENKLLNLSWILLVLFVLIFSINSFLSTGDDFSVFWNAGRNWISGVPLYDIQRDGPQCYKYPPWIAPLFIPFSILPARIADVCWRLLLLKSMLWCCLWTVKGSRRPYVGILIFIAFWGIWMNNLVSGQVTPILLMLAIIGFSLHNQGRFWGAFVLFISLSAKVFNLIAFLSVRRGSWNKKALSLILFSITFTTLISLFGYRGDFQKMLDAFSMTSGGNSSLLGGANYGLPVLWMKVFSISPSSYGRVLAFLMSVPLVYLFWKMLQARQVSQREELAFWLAIGAVLHPLQFSYGFVWVFPFTVFALESVLDSGRCWRVCAGILGICGLIFIDRLGFSFLEDLPVRSLSLLVLVGLWFRSKSPKL